jgi:carbon-monoxide dehydrogenase medium subunit
MKPASFKYHAPKTVDEAAALLAALAPQDGRILAGGQSLVPTMAFRMARPAHLIDINGIAALETLALDGGALSIGACVRHAAFHGSAVQGPLGGLLNAVVRHIAHHPIRVRGTFCGSLANADPASEWCLVAVTLGAQLQARSVRGTRRIAAADFFTGLMSTDLAEDELLIEARLPALAADTRFAFQEFNRRAGDFALGMALVTLRLVDGLVAEPRIGTGGIEAYPRRMAAAERLLEGQAPSADLFRAAAAAVARDVDPIDDATTPAAYRRDLSETLTFRALERALA